MKKVTLGQSKFSLHGSGYIIEQKPDGKLKSYKIFHMSSAGIMATNLKVFVTWDQLGAKNV